MKLFPLQVRSSFLKAIGRRDLAQNQQSMVTVSRKLSTTTGPSRLLNMRRRSSQFSGSLTVRLMYTPYSYGVPCTTHRLEDSTPLLKRLPSEEGLKLTTPTSSMS